MNPASAPITQLAIRRGGLAYNDRVVLQNVNVRFDAGHLHLLYGSGGAGKSSLLRALAGHARRLATMRVWGDWLADGRAITAQHAPTLVHQQPSSSGARVSDDLRSAIPERAALTISEQWTRVTEVLIHYGLQALLERRDEPVYRLDLSTRKALATARALISEPRAILGDELTADCDENTRATMLRALGECARRRVVVLASHDVRDLDEPNVIGWTLKDRRRDLPASLRVIDGDRGESAPIALAPRAPPSLVWIEPRLLGGMPRPGLLTPLEDDLARLAGLGIRRLVCLEEAIPYPPEAPARQGIELRHLPIVDMEAPSNEVAFRALVRELLEGLDHELPTAVHCKGGLGRTGLLLALLHALRQGIEPVDAVTAIRLYEPRFVQSDAQWRFIERHSLSEWRAALRESPPSEEAFPASGEVCGR